MYSFVLIGLGVRLGLGNGVGRLHHGLTGLVERFTIYDHDSRDIVGERGRREQRELQEGKVYQQRACDVYATATTIERTVPPGFVRRKTKSMLCVQYKTLVRPRNETIGIS